MKAIVFDHPGDESVMQLREVPSPPLRPQHVRIQVTAAGVNRADLLQRRGHYPPPPGASEILGMECGGEISAIGEGVTRWKIGDRVMALIPGGGYAEEAIAHEGSLIAVPSSFSDTEGGTFPEAFLTAFLNLFLLGEVREGETALIHGGGSGVGTSAIQLCREAGVPTIVTVGSKEKGERCIALGAHAAINYKQLNFPDEVHRLTDRRGVDVILDHLGGPYVASNIASLAKRGRLVMIGSMGGSSGALDVSAMLSRHLRIIGSTLRARPDEEKAKIVDAFLARFGDAVAKKKIAPIVDHTFSLADAGEAHRLMASSAHFGKIALTVR